MAKNNKPKPANTPANPAVTATKPDTVTVDREALESLLRTVEAQETRLNRVESAADVGRLSQFDSKNLQKGPTQYRLSTFNTGSEEAPEIKVIKAWKTVANMSRKNPATGHLEVDQRYTIVLEDDSQFTITGYLEFSDIRYASQIVVEEVSRTVVDGRIILTVRKPDGTTFDIDTRFVN